MLISIIKVYYSLVSSPCKVHMPIKELTYSWGGVFVGLFFQFLFYIGV